MVKKAIYIISAVLSFLCFVTGMLFAEQIPVLTLVGILGLAGFSYTVFMGVTNFLISKDKI